MTQTSAGKGDRYRKVDTKKYREGYERIFGKCNVRHKDTNTQSNSTSSREVDTDE